MSRRPIALCLALLTVLPLATFAATNEHEPLPRLFDHLPRDPLFAWAVTNLEPLEIWDGLIELGGRFLPEEEMAEMRASIAAVDESIGMSLRDDLLARIGPEVAVFFDLPDLDQTAQQVMMGQATASQIFGSIAFVTGTADGEALERALLQLTSLVGGEPIVTDGPKQVRFAVPNEAAQGDPAQAAAPGPGAFLQHVDLFFQSSDGLLVAGFDQGFVERALAGLGKEDSLAAGEDFRRVFEQLDRQPESLTYFNIPKFVARITGSQMVGGILAANEEAAPMLELLSSPELTGMGVGSTSVTVHGGQRTTTYGPSLLSDSFQIGLISAIFVPNFLEALDKAKQKRTLMDMRAAGAALEGFALVNDGYPGPTEGWVPLGDYSQVLQAGSTGLPLEDGWGHPLLYSSDGATYRLLSPGKDGLIGELPTIEGQEAESAAYDADIVLADGAFSG